MLCSLGGYLAKMYIIISLFFKFSVLLLLLCFHSCPHFLICICTVQLFEMQICLFIWKCYDMACLLGVKWPAWFPILILLLFRITILSFYFDRIKLFLMFTFWCFACRLKHKKVQTNAYYFDRDTQYVHFRGNPFIKPQKKHLNNNLCCLTVVLWLKQQLLLFKCRW